MNRKQKKVQKLLFAAILLIMIAQEVKAKSGQTRDEQPNIVIILADDLGWVDLSANKTSLGNGSKYHQTPNIERLADQGMSFVSMYVCQNCAPSRASLLSGQYAPGTGIYNVNNLDRGDKNSVIKPIKQRTDLKPEFITLAETLQKAGYVTVHLGKWHLGPDQQIGTEHGFDYSYSGDGEGFKNVTGKDNHFFAEKDQNEKWKFNLYGERMFQFAQPYSKEYVKKYLQPYSNGNDPKEIIGSSKEINDALADATADFLRNKHKELGKDKPFFMYVALNLVHVPIQPRADLLSKYTKMVSGDLRHSSPEYAACVEHADQVTARILDQLKDPDGDGDCSDDVSDNTIVLFLSDNGAPGKISNNEPLRGYKGMQYDGGTRVPLIVRWPEKIRAGAVSKEALHIIDLYPTICDLVKINYPDNKLHKLNGESFEPILSGAKDTLNRNAVFFHFPGYMDNRSQPSTIMIRDFGEDRYKMFYYYESRKYELYEISQDISESKNLLENNSSGKAMKVAGEMRNEMLKWLEEMNPDRMKYRAGGGLVPLPIEIIQE